MRLSKLEWVVDWGPFASLVAQPRRSKIVKDEDEDGEEDMTLYEWPYLHSDELL